MRRPLLVLAAVLVGVAVSLLAVSGAGGSSAQVPKRGGTVVVAELPWGEKACFNPLLDSCSWGYLHLVLPGAYDVRPDATYRPRLASARIVSRQPFTLLYDIRGGARWSDDVPITARDFAFTHDAIRKLGSPDDWHHTQVRSVRPVGVKTVKVVLRAPFVDWPELFPFVLPRHALAGEDLAQVWQDAIDDPRTGAPIGSGPFLVERVDPTRQLVLRRNPRYWGPHLAYLERIVTRFVAPSDVAEAMGRGEVDMIVPGPPVFLAPTLEVHRKVPGIRSLFTRVGAWEHLDIRIDSGGHPWLKKPLVRQALAYGIDREAIARAALELVGKPDPRAEPLDSVVFLANSRYYRPNWKSYRYRPALAQKLLEQAGCRRGADRIFVCGEERLSLRLGTSSGSDRRKRTLELAQASLLKVGVEIIPEYFHPTVWGGVLKRGEFDLFQFGFGAGARTTGPLEIFGCQQPANFTGYCDPIGSLAARARVLNHLDAKLAEAVPVLPVVQPVARVFYRSNVRGIVLGGFVLEFQQNSEDWWLAE